MSNYNYFKIKFKGTRRCLYYRSKLKRIDLKTICIPVGNYEFWTLLYKSWDEPMKMEWVKSYDMSDLSYRKRLIPISEGEFMLEVM